MENSQRPRCQTCRHSFVTWDARLPRGCRAHGFKSADPPSQVVETSSGMPCQLFEARGKDAGPQRNTSATALDWPADRFERSS